MRSHGSLDPSTHLPRPAFQFNDFFIADLDPSVSSAFPLARDGGAKYLAHRVQLLCRDLDALRTCQLGWASHVNSPLLQAPPPVSGPNSGGGGSPPRHTDRELHQPRGAHPPCAPTPGPFTPAQSVGLGTEAGSHLSNPSAPAWSGRGSRPARRTSG